MAHSMHQAALRKAGSRPASAAPTAQQPTSGGGGWFGWLKGGHTPKVADQVKMAADHDRPITCVS